MPHLPTLLFQLWTQVKRETLVEVLTKRKTITVNDKLILPYSLSEVSVSPGQGCSPGEPEPRVHLLPGHKAGTFKQSSIRTHTRDLDV